MASCSASVSGRADLRVSQGRGVRLVGEVEVQGGESVR